MLSMPSMLIDIHYHSLLTTKKMSLNYHFFLDSALLKASLSFLSFLWISSNLSF